jgi:hypothetical protein
VLPSHRSFYEGIFFFSPSSLSSSVLHVKSNGEHRNENNARYFFELPLNHFNIARIKKEITSRLSIWPSLAAENDEASACDVQKN